MFYRLLWWVEFIYILFRRGYTAISYSVKNINVTCFVVCVLRLFLFHTIKVQYLLEGLICG